MKFGSLGKCLGLGFSYSFLKTHWNRKRVFQNNKKFSRWNIFESLGFFSGLHSVNIFFFFFFSVFFFCSVFEFLRRCRSYNRLGCSYVRTVRRFSEDLRGFLMLCFIMIGTLFSRSQK